ncbi:acyltransferase family protein [Novilysobacter arseniciresistens]|uniref:acyltransferase family protein n=1 Tax=Novilysobacter arseniciresistens TaxID=1385522 RepID=UPI00126A3EAE|nr:acyltransferase family protein [Lysobacter arseniciresistens]
MTIATARGQYDDSPSNHSRKGRILELDAVRGIAALGVVVYHYGAHFGSRPFDALLYPFYNAGFLLVDFFFVVSGGRLRTVVTDHFSSYIAVVLGVSALTHSYVELPAQRGVFSLIDGRRIAKSWKGRVQ